MRIRAWAWKLGYVTKAELEAEQEKVAARDSLISEYRRRLEAGTERQNDLATKLAAIKPAKPAWTRALALVWVLLIGVALGGIAIPHNYDAPSLAATPDPVISDTIALPQTFAWPGTEGASAYVVQIWKDSTLIQEHTFGDIRGEIALSPGMYQWLVFPIINGIRQDATINSSITIG